MSKGQHNSSHPYRGTREGRAARLSSKLGRTITLQRLERLLARAQQLVAQTRAAR